MIKHGQVDPRTKKKSVGSVSYPKIAKNKSEYEALMKSATGVHPVRPNSSVDSLHKSLLESFWEKPIDMQALEHALNTCCENKTKCDAILNDTNQMRLAGEVRRTGT